MAGVQKMQQSLAPLTALTQPNVFANMLQIWCAVLHVRQSMPGLQNCCVSSLCSINNCTLQSGQDHMRACCVDGDPFLH